MDLVEFPPQIAQDAEFTPTLAAPMEPGPKQARVTHTLKGKQLIDLEKLFLILSGDTGKIAKTMNLPLDVVRDAITSNRLKLPERKPSQSLAQLQKRKKFGYYSMRNYSKKLLQNITNHNSLHPWYQPCTHAGPCSESSCECMQNAFFCTKACVHAEYSPNFFRGCDCKGDCAQSYCSCFAAGRECDPDLCKSCQTCTDLPRRLTANSYTQRCRNDNISMKRYQRLLVGKSSVPGAGWGLFTKDRLRKGDFIQEYLGEIVSTHEGDRRHIVYNQNGSNYLFDQSKDYYIDGMNKGSKARFANHSNNPNMTSKKVFVNGDIRIGFFATKDIPAQAELFFHYRNLFKGNFLGR